MIHEVRIATAQRSFTDINRVDAHVTIDFNLKTENFPRLQATPTPEEVVANRHDAIHSVEYTRTDLNILRNSLKLSSKFLFGKKAEITKEEATPRLKVATEVGAVLASLGAPSSLVAAGFLCNALDKVGTQHWDLHCSEREGIISRKFGAEIVTLIKSASDILQSPKRISSEITPEIRLLMAVRAHAEAKLNNSLVGETSQSIPHSELIYDAPYCPEAIAQTTQALELVHRIFDGVPRKWGNNETLPLATHAAEVGLILIAARAPISAVLSGFAHDLFEGYVPGSLEGYRAVVTELFGSRVADIIEAVTEPPKMNTDQNWWDRKRRVLTQLLHCQEHIDVATVAAAAKVSTLAAGNKVLYERHPVSEWSAGSFKQNLLFHKALGALFELAHVPSLITEAYDFELGRFSSWHAAHPEGADPIADSIYEEIRSIPMVPQYLERFPLTA